MEERYARPLDPRTPGSVLSPPPAPPGSRLTKSESYEQSDRDDSEASGVASWLLYQRRRVSRATPAWLAIIISGIVLIALTGHPATRPRVLRAVAEYNKPVSTARLLPPALVGERRFPNLYYGQGCSASNLLASIGHATILPEGASRTLGNESTQLALPAFNFSFVLPGCPPPHVFSSEEACDLVSSFGGVFMRGDSFVRHVHNALLMLLRGRTDGAILEQGFNSRCRGDGMFDDRKECRATLLEDTQDSNEPLCDGDIYAFYLRAELKDEHDLSPFYQWQDWLPAEKRMHSPIIYQSSGIHYQYDPATTVNYIQPVIDLAARSFPGIISFWAGLHAPGENLPKEYAETQGREAILSFNAKIQRIINFRSPGELGDGAMKMIPWFNVTDGAASYDGVHYGMQVNMEKVQLLLNLLDIVWGEISQAGGVVGLMPAMPPRPH